ncbi:MAG TPA: cytochrome P460 family protein [Bryobacteraceae bacterium]
MNKAIFCVAGCLFVTLAVAAGQAADDGPQYTADGQLLFPKDYREWVFLSSGLGMTYGPAGAAASEAPRFDNVFVNRSAYKSFLASGRWPDKTIFILEVRKSQSEGSINRGGHFQTSTAAVEAHVKDEKRFAGNWAFFGFGEGKQSGKLIPTSASCYSCHRDHGAVDTTFVQFYPTLIDVAKKKQTMR